MSKGIQRHANRCGRVNAKPTGCVSSISQCPALAPENYKQSAGLDEWQSVAHDGTSRVRGASHGDSG